MAQCNHHDNDGRRCENEADATLTADFADGSENEQDICSSCKAKFLEGWDRMQRDAAALRERGLSKKMLERVMCLRVERGLY
jgi:hypothetical protein